MAMVMLQIWRRAAVSGGLTSGSLVIWVCVDSPQNALPLIPTLLRHMFRSYTIYMVGRRFLLVRVWRKRMMRPPRHTAGWQIAKISWVVYQLKNDGRWVSEIRRYCSMLVKGHAIEFCGSMLMRISLLRTHTLISKYHVFKNVEAQILPKLKQGHIH